MRDFNEIRIKAEQGISDEIAICLVAKVISQGKISQNSKGAKKYCWLTTFEVEGEEINVCLRDYRKTTMFYVYKN